MKELPLERTVVVELAASVGGTELEVRQVCQGGPWLFLLLAYRDERASMTCAVVAVDRQTLEPGAVHPLGYIKHDNGGGTLRCTASGARVSVGREFGVVVLEHADGSFTASQFVDTEQHTEEGWFAGEDRLLHMDEMSEGGLVLTDLREDTASVLVQQWVARYGVSPVGPFGAFMGAPPAEDTPLELVFFSLPELAILGRRPLGGVRDELLFHPREPAVLTVDGGRLVRIDVGPDGGTTERALRAEPTGRFASFDSTGRWAFASTGYYALPRTPPTIEVWDAAEDRLSEVCLPVHGRAWWMLPDDRLVVAHRGAEPAEGVRLSFVEAVPR